MGGSNVAVSDNKPLFLRIIVFDVKRNFSLRAGRCADTLKCLHADNVSIQKSSTLRATLEWLGVEPSYSRPRVSNDNA